MELKYAIQNYPWGKSGTKSLVAQLKSSADEDFKIDDLLTYAELWLGVHPNGESYVKSSNTPLSVLISNNLDKAFHNGGNKFCNQMPFLFKVLSVNKPLSIQVHPSKQQAELLHNLHPEIYKDDNHKPEMSIALTNAEILCSFRHFEEINHYLSSLPELKSVIAVDNCNIQSSEHLRIYFKRLMTASKELVKSNLNDLLNRLQSSDNATREKYMFHVLSRANEYFPGDVGCFCVYFLNYIVLNPGDAIFIPHGEPHAYLYGDLIECMANSDNVVRAGLTPKPVDVETLTDILNYTQKFKDEIYIKGKIIDIHSVFYVPPVDEFAVLKIFLKLNDCYDLPPRKTASILICINGSGNLNDIYFKKGQAFLLWSNETAKISSLSDQLLIFQAFGNIN